MNRMDGRLLIAVLTLALLAPATARAQDPPAGGGDVAKTITMKIGFANIKRIIDDYERTKTIEVEIDDYRRGKTDEIEKKRKRLKELRDDMKMLNPDSRMYFEKVKLARRMEMEIKLAEDELKVDLQYRLLRATKEIYEDITNQIKEYAQKNGFHVIFKVEKGKIESESKGELILKINSRGVLYYDKSLDVSDAIIKILNVNYTGVKPPEDGAEKKEGEGEKKEAEGEKKEAEGEKKEGEGEKKEGEGTEKAGGEEEKPGSGGEEKKSGE